MTDELLASDTQFSRGASSMLWPLDQVAAVLRPWPSPGTEAGLLGCLYFCLGAVLGKVPGVVHPCPQRPYDIHSSNAVESLVQLFSTVSVQYVPTWSKEMVALLRKVSFLLSPSPRVPIPSATLSGPQGDTPSFHGLSPLH